MIDVSQFTPLNVVDTCAVWNILSSRLLFDAARSVPCSLSLTQFIRYECLEKRRSRIHFGDAELQKRLRSAITAQEIGVYSIDIADLQEVEILRNRRKLSLGELSAMAFAKRTRQAFLTDDQGARKLAKDYLPGAVQTTPQLLGWLVFSGRIDENEKSALVQEHESLGGHIATFLEAAFDEGVRCRSMMRPSP